MTIKSGVIEGFEGYSQFVSLEEFNRHLEMWLAVHKHDFSKGELVGLKRLARFAAKIPGVSNAKIGTVLKAIHEEYNELGISRSTFKRMIIKASNLGIFTVHETERKNGSQSSNLYVFNRFPNNEPPKKEKMNHQNKTIIPSETKTIKNNKREETAFHKAPEDHLFVSDRIPKPFVDLAKYFFPSAKAIEEFWKMTTIAAYKNNQENEAETILSVSLDSFKQLIRKMKTKVTVKNPLAYYTGILNKKFQELYFGELFEMGF
ncbi:hypothetical protein [Mesobacillus selenatarsenatis]|uniref:Phage protein n=1 Tax=Mesobacillus selenatarsenatis (strain DSM 18680 / JCM 14380 / FERM P-15431 / SF-1) TaxID=1321606 RepID=A0A0A8WWY3_MESS1|nr:hypothetical protein [Mesobacillus selenatarsenatis]GAM12170.1 phage protein [Mesobacillus selenatarsenatis SF-1]